MSTEWKPGDVALRKSSIGAPDLVGMFVGTTFCTGAGHDDRDHWHYQNGNWSPSNTKTVHRRLVVIDAEDREQIERLMRGMWEHGRRTWEATDNAIQGRLVDALTEALREFANPKREWTDGDVVQHEDATYTAQRRDGLWYTTSMGDGAAWGTDEYVSTYVESGRLVVLREQAAEVQP